MKKSLLLSFVLLSGVLMVACENKTDQNLEDTQTCSL
jgi:hypothetical protein